VIFGITPNVPRYRQKRSGTAFLKTPGEIA